MLLLVSCLAVVVVMVFQVGAFSVEKDWGAFSQPQPAQQPQLTTTAPPENDSFLNIDFIYGFIGALVGLVPIVVAVAHFLKKSVNSSTEAFIEKQTEAYERKEKETRQQLRDHEERVSGQITNINNNLNAKANDTKEDIMEIKKTIENIDEKIDESRTSNTENKIRLNEIERRVGNLETNRTANSALGSFGIK